MQIFQLVESPQAKEFQVIKVPGTNAVVRLDEVTGFVFIGWQPEDAISPEEVIQHLGSECLADRTRCEVTNIIPDPRQRETALKLIVRIWEWWMESDIAEALQDFFAQKGLVCA
jgi:hypothetical protein